MYHSSAVIIVPVTHRDLDQNLYNIDYCTRAESLLGTQRSPARSELILGLCTLNLQFQPM